MCLRIGVGIVPYGVVYGVEFWVFRKFGLCYVVGCSYMLRGIDRWYHCGGSFVCIVRVACYYDMYVGVCSRMM